MKSDSGLPPSEPESVVFNGQNCYLNFESSWLKHRLLKFPEIPIVPVRDKRPLVKWGEWIDRPQTPEERELMLRQAEEAGGYAVICGHEVPEYGYLFCIDVDIPFEEIRSKLGEIPVTYMEGTPSGGLHLFYFAKNGPPPTKSFSGIPVELKGRGSLVVVAPTSGYRFLNDNMPRVVENAIEVFKQALRAFGGVDDPDALFEAEAEKVIDYRPEEHSLLSPWLETIESELERRGLVKRRTLKYVMCHCPRHPPDKHPSFVINRLKYYVLDYHDGRIFNLKELAAELGIELPMPAPQPKAEAGTETKGKSRTILSLTLPGPVMLEAIGVLNGLGEYEPRLLILGPNGFEVREFYQNGDSKIAPRSPRTYPYPPYVVEDLSLRKRQDLVEMVSREVNRFVDAPEEDRAIFVGFIVLSYVQEKFDALPYLYIVGDNSSGKTHLLRLMDALGYRPMSGASLTAADLYTYLEEDGPPMTIIEDEFQGSEKDNDKMKIYKTGYKRGARVPRVVTFEGGRRIDYFQAFGLKIMAAEELTENKGLRERCVVVELVEGAPEKDFYDDDDRARFARIRAELLKWRMAVLAGKDELPRLELDWLRGRNRELYLPLLTVLHGTPLYDLVERRVRTEIEQRVKEKASSLEAVVYHLALKQVEARGLVVFPDLWNDLLEALNGVEERTSSVSIARAMETESHGRVTKAQISKILTEKFAMRRERTKIDGRTVVIFRPSAVKLQMLKRKYGGTDPPSTPT